MSSSANRPSSRKVAGQRSRERQQTSAEAVPVAEVDLTATPSAAATGAGPSRLRLRRKNREAESDHTPAGPATSAAQGAKAASSDAAEGGPLPGSAAGTESLAAGGPRRWWPCVTALVAACALLAAVLVYVVRQPDVASASARAAAVGSAQSTLETLLSYDYKTFDQHVEQVKPQLVAPFLDQFSAAAGNQLKTLATTNQTVVQARVYNVGVMDTTRQTVKVLAFVNQATTTTANPDPQIDQNRVIATMKQVGDRWLVSDLEAF